MMVKALEYGSEVPQKHLGLRVRGLGLPHHGCM